MTSSRPFNFTITGSSSNDINFVVDSTNSNITGSTSLDNENNSVLEPILSGSNNYLENSSTSNAISYNNAGAAGAAGAASSAMQNETNSYFTKIPITFNNLDKLKKVKAIKLFNSNYEIISTAGANTSFITSNKDNIFYTTSNTIISENKRTGLINWTLDWSQILDQDKKLGGEVYRRQTANIFPRNNHPDLNWATPIEIRYPPGISKDGTKLYITNVDFVHDNTQLYLIEIDAERGEVLKTQMMDELAAKTDYLGDAVINTIPNSSIAVRTSVTVEDISNIRYLTFGGTAGLEYAAELFGIINNESANYLEVNNNAARGAVVCYKKDLNNPDSNFELNWIRHSGPQHYIGFGGPDPLTNEQSHPDRTRFPSQNREINDNYIAVNKTYTKDNSMVSILSIDSFIPDPSHGILYGNNKYDPSINLFVPMCNKYKLYVNDLSNAKHDGSNIPQYIVSSNKLLIKTSTGVSAELDCDFFLNNMDVITKFYHELVDLCCNDVSSSYYNLSSTSGNGYNAPLKKVNKPASKIKYSTGPYAGLPVNPAIVYEKLVPDSIFAGSVNAKGRYSMQINNLLFTKDISDNDPSYNIIPNKFNIYKVTGGVHDQDRSEELLFANCDIYDISRTIADVYLDAADGTQTVSIDISDGIIIDSSNIIFRKMSDGSAIEISSKMLISQNIQKVLDISLLDISGGYKLDSSEASRLNYTGSGLWVSRFTYDNCGGIIITYGNGNSLPIHESLNYIKSNVRTPSGEWFPYILSPIDASNIDKLYEDIMVKNIHESFPKMLSVYGYLQTQYNKTKKTDILAKVYNLHKRIKEVSEERDANMYKYISKRGLRNMTCSVACIDLLSGATKWRSQTPDWNDANWNFNTWVNSRNKNFTTFQSPGWTDASAHEYNYIYTTDASKRRYIEYYPPGMDNDTAMPLADISGFFIVANKGGHIFKLKKDKYIDISDIHPDISYINNEDSTTNMKIIENDFIYGTRELGCNFVGDNNYGYYCDDEYYIGNSRNFSELGTNLMYFNPDLSFIEQPKRLDEKHIINNFPMGHSAIMVVNLETNDISFVKTRNEVKPSPLHTAVVGYRKSLTDKPVVMVGDPFGTLHVLDIETMKSKKYETGLPIVRANIILNDNQNPTRINIIGDNPKGLAFTAGIGIDSDSVDEIGKFEIDPFNIIIKDTEYVLPGDSEVPQYATEL